LFFNAAIIIHSEFVFEVTTVNIHYYLGVMERLLRAHAPWHKREFRQKVLAVVERQRAL
jgi:hypothetical protein